MTTCVWTLLFVGASAAPQILRVTASPSDVVLGGDGPTEVQLEIETEPRDVSLGLAGVRVHTTAGHIEALRQTSPTRITASLKAPTEKFPQLAVVSVADVSDPSGVPNVVTTTVSYAARLSLRGKSEPRSSVELEVGGRRFGPVTAEPTGAFVIDIVVPPGEGFAEVRSRDRLGNSSRSRVNLYLPEVKRLHAFVCPEVVRVSSTAHVFVTHVAARGTTDKSPLRAYARRGVVEDSDPLGHNITRLLYRAPASLDDGVDTLELSASGDKADVMLALLSGPPAAITQMAADAVPADGVAQAELVIRVTDGVGNAAAGHLVTVTLDQETVKAEEKAGGMYAARFAARAKAGRARATVRVDPHAQSCAAPRLLHFEGRAFAVDSRGVRCAGRFRLLERPQVTGDLADGIDIEATNPGESVHLVDANGAESVVSIERASAGLPALPLVGFADVQWRVPTPVTLRLEVASRQADSVTLHLIASGMSELEKRVRLAASAGELRVVGREAQGLTLLLARSRESSAPVDVLATDSQSGVAAYVRVE